MFSWSSFSVLQMRKVDELRAFNRFLRAYTWNDHSDYKQVCEGMRDAMCIVNSLSHHDENRIHSRLVCLTHECIQTHTCWHARTSLDTVGARQSVCVWVCSSVILCTTKYSCHGFSDSKALKNRLFGEMKFEIVVDTDSELSICYYYDLYIIASAQHLFTFVFLTFLFDVHICLFIFFIKFDFIYWHLNEVR